MLIIHQKFEKQTQRQVFGLIRPEDRDNVFCWFQICAMLHPNLDLRLRGEIMAFSASAIFNKIHYL